MDTIAAYDIKVSDYDVAADTVGATINAVTKSGTNEFHGSVYYVYKSASDLVGNRDGEDYDLYDTDKTMGVTFGGPIRSEEHTSERQSLMRSSYAVFCLKKNIDKT